MNNGTHNKYKNVQAGNVNIFYPNSENFGYTKECNIIIITNIGQQVLSFNNIVNDNQVLSYITPQTFFVIPNKQCSKNELTMIIDKMMHDLPAKGLHVLSVNQVTIDRVQQHLPNDIINIIYGKPDTNEVSHSNNDGNKPVINTAISSDTSINKPVIDTPTVSATDIPTHNENTQILHGIANAGTNNVSATGDTTPNLANNPKTLTRTKTSNAGNISYFLLSFVTIMLTIIMIYLLARG